MLIGFNQRFPHFCAKEDEKLYSQGNYDRMTPADRRGRAVPALLRVEISKPMRLGDGL